MTPVDAMLRILSSRGQCRCYELERLTGARGAQGMLAPLVAEGHLVACRILRPGQPDAFEYRLSAANGRLTKPSTHSSGQEQILRLLQVSGQRMRPRDIIKATGLPSGSVSAHLLSLWAKRRIRRHGSGKRYEYEAAA